MSEVFDLILSELRKVVPYRSASVQRLDGDEWVIEGGYGYPDLDELVGHRYRVSGPSDPAWELVERHGTLILSDARRALPAVRGCPRRRKHQVVDGRSVADRRPPDRDADVRLVRGRLLHRRACERGEGVCRVRRHGDREGALPHRAPAGARGGGGGDTGEERLPRDHEPRDPHADERHHRHERTPTAHRPRRGATRVRGDHPYEQRSAPHDHQRHPRLLEGRGGTDGARDRAVRLPSLRRRRARAHRLRGVGQGPRARVRDRRRRAPGDPRRRRAASPDPAQRAEQRGEVHGGGRHLADRDRIGGRGRRAHRASPGRPRYRHRHPAGPGRPPVPILQPGRRLDQSAVRRHGPRPRHLETACRAHGRNDVGRERGRPRPRQRVPLHACHTRSGGDRAA